MVDYEQKPAYHLEDLQEIVRLLRSPGGCPWDREQTHETLRGALLEEAYEAAEAVDLREMSLLREELGDVLLQVVFHSELAQEAGEFTFDEVCDGICKKLIVRHPHVFGDVKAEDTETVLKNWDAIKQKTKGQKTAAETLRSVAKSLPALLRAQKVGDRAARAGMDFGCMEDAFDCVRAERSELQAAIAAGDRSMMEEELGDLLFSCVNTARHLGLDAEQALTRATEKFTARFEAAERLIEEDGNKMTELSDAQLDAYWARAKAALRRAKKEE